jgi:hypothetical protein
MPYALCSILLATGFFDCGEAQGTGRKATGIGHGAGHLPFHISSSLNCHLPPASLGHYAALSFVAIGQSQRLEVTGRRAEELWTDLLRLTYNR